MKVRHVLSWSTQKCSVGEGHHSSPRAFQEKLAFSFIRINPSLTEPNFESCNTTLPFEYKNEIICCDHSNKSEWYFLVIILLLRTKSFSFSNQMKARQNFVQWDCLFFSPFHTTCVQKNAMFRLWRRKEQFHFGKESTPTLHFWGKKVVQKSFISTITENTFDQVKSRGCKGYKIKPLAVLWFKREKYTKFKQHKVQRFLTITLSGMTALATYQAEALRNLSNILDYLRWRPRS